ncbi:PA0069 family radical SAM protein [Marilutibacter alkalisoli]|uniref:PA0069 family radical SAM protein n=1 Tax=Marilutibacter alkalisoli TaxID=2591633 RepID=A0A514BNS4_9GAMM|nr:PA0069 family radical SAM protein [Lysobacter alkalisoli]QDH68689.1 PA0069 family radical SAM protein [Lysobacter alkalisoli]
MDDARKAIAPSPHRVKGRGAASYVDGRYAVTRVEGEDDGWGSLGAELADQPHPATRVQEERARTIISRNDSPDIGFSQSVNPYRGCEHGCVYCFARPSHAYLDLSPGLDFETRLFAKGNAAERLRHELSKPGYRCAPIALGINTDAYQPIERRYRITRQCLEVLAECRHPVSFVTKGATILRDLDLLAAMARERLVTVYVSITTLDNRLAARMEPRASAPHTRLKMVRELHAAGVPVGILAAPVIPMINDGEIEAILEAAHEAGAHAAGHVLLRLPHELKQIWREWLELHYPDRAAHVMSLIRQMRGGKDYDSAFGTRMRGTGPFAELVAQRFARAHRRLGYGRLPALETRHFVPPRRPTPQGELF